MLPALVGWVAAPESTVGWFSAVSVGSGISFLGHGQSIGAGGVAVSLTPLLLLGVNVYIAYRWARRLAATQRLAVGASAWSDVALRGVVPGFLGGYLLMGGVFALFTLGGVAAPGLAAVPGVLLVPLLALGFVLVRPDDDDSPAFVRAVFRRGPTWLPTVWRVGWRGAGLLLAVGVGVVVLRLLLTFPSVLAIQSDYGVNVGGAVIVGLAQLALLGNAVTWALGFVAGPGFALALGSTVSPAGAVPGLLPLVPRARRGARGGRLPPVLHAVLLLPVAAGLLIGRGSTTGWSSSATCAPGSRPRRSPRCSPSPSSSPLTALGNGAVGVDRLRAVGVPLLPFAAALAAEVLAGALLWLGYLLLRERHASAGSRPRTPADRDRTETATPPRLRPRRTTGPVSAAQGDRSRLPWVSRRPEGG